jgi:hypothetical protein
MTMWRADENGRPHIPEGDPDPIPYKPLWGEVEVNPAKHNAEKEMLRVSESIEKKKLHHQRNYQVHSVLEVWHGKGCEVCRGDVILR